MQFAQKVNKLMIAHKVNQLMAGASRPGNCKVVSKEDGTLTANFVFADGSESPVTVGGFLTEKRTWEDFSATAAKAFLSRKAG